MCLNQAEVRGKEDRNGITTFRRCRPYQTVIPGDSAIPGSRATGATTSTITRDCDRPIDDEKGVADRANVKRGSETSAEKGGNGNRETPYNLAAKATGRSEGKQRGEKEVASPSKAVAIRRGERGWMLTMKIHGVEISIAGGGEEIVRD